MSKYGSRDERHVKHFRDGRNGPPLCGASTAHARYATSGDDVTCLDCMDEATEMMSPTLNVPEWAQL
jgi:hypothetical protein